jgi:glycosyltransferase involved in cell wall biosynthesis
MKIALLSEKYTPDIGGLAISTERLARLLTSAEHEVLVFCPSPNLSPAEKRILTSNGVTVTRFGTHKRVDDTLVDWFELIVAENTREQFDVLHAYFLTQAGFVAAYAGKYLNLPSVVSIRGNDIERATFDPSRFSHTKYALENASAVTTNAKELVKKAKAFFDREITLIPNGIDAEHFKPRENIARLTQTLRLIEASNPPSYFGQQQPATFQNRVIGFVGELREKKGLKVLLPALATINKTRSTSLLVVGTVRQSDDRQFFDEFITLNPNLQIFVTGYISSKDLPTYYSMMDVFVHPSLRDGMPNALLEAMACERAIVATPVGGILDAVKDSETGLIVPANDAEALSNAILKLLDDQPLRSSLGKSARELIQREFTLQEELDLNLNVYKRLGLTG